MEKTQDYISNNMKKVYLKPWGEIITLDKGMSLLETFSSKATTKDFELGEDLNSETDWVDAGGEFL